MKKGLLKGILSLVLCLCLTACGGAPEEGLGSYVCVRAESGETELDPQALFPGGLSLELGSGGKGLLTLDGETGAVRWSLDGEALRLETGKGLSKGSLRAGVLTLDLLGTGLELTFTAEGAPLPSPEPGPLDSLQGSWQGWWEFSEAGARYSELGGQGRVCYAEILPGEGESVRLLLWDADSSREEPAAWAELRPGEEVWAENTAGAVLGIELPQGQWQLDREAAEKGFVLSGRCEDAKGAFTYSIRLERAEEPEGLE